MLNLAWVTLLICGEKLLKCCHETRARKVRIEGNRAGWSLKAENMSAVALTNSIAGFESGAPDAKLDDGNFTLIIVKTAKLLHVVMMIQAINWRTGFMC